MPKYLYNRMVNENDANAYAAAMLAQLNAEIIAAGTTAKELAAKMGVNYNNYWRYTAGKRPMPMNVFWATLDALGLDETVFVTRARERRQTGTVPPAQ